ncbi:MAG: hypothetical protein WCC10_01630, partial [Tumebacillaceae bacterium]
MKTVKPAHLEDTRQSARHTLYVEGNERSIDFTALNELFDRQLTIRGMGPRSNVAAVAKALFADHPNYYFLIDRDAQSEAEVEQSWAHFPDASKHNLLIWPRKEIENYFIDPAIITKTEFFQNGKEDEYIARLQQEATKRVYCEAANRVIIELRECIKEAWIDCFKFRDGEFDTFDNTQKPLLELPNFPSQTQKVSTELDLKKVKERFEREVANLLGGSATCVMGTGNWFELMSGKELLEVMVHNTSFFRVVGLDNRPRQGEEKMRGLVANLIRFSKEHWPADFTRLKTIIEHRVRTT